MPAETLPTTDRHLSGHRQVYVQPSAPGSHVAPWAVIEADVIDPVNGPHRHVDHLVVCVADGDTAIKPAEARIRQFLDIGTGIPSAGNLHEVAGQVAPDARVVYVDNDRCKSGCAHIGMESPSPRVRTG